MRHQNVIQGLYLAFVTLALAAPGRAAILRVNGVAPGPVHDGASWATAYATIQSALNAAQPGDEVWVAAGKYSEDVALPVADLKMLGGFAGTEGTAAPMGGASVLTGKTAGQPIVRIPAAASGALLQGFTVIGGSSGGILCEASGVVIAHNEVLNNTARHGGGILCRNASVTIRNNVIAFNWAEYRAAGATDTPGDVGGGIAVFGGAVDIRGNEIANNLCYTVAANTAPYTVTAYGGGIAVRDGVAHIVNNTIASNSVHVWAYQRAADAAGAGISLVGSGVVANNILSGNYTDFTAGTGSVAHGALHLVPSAASPVRNNLFHGNDPDDAADYVGRDGNIAGDPLFRTDLPSPYVPDLRLKAGSPAIDMGDDAYLLPGETDRRGQPRKMGARVDIGAQEFVPAPTAPMSRVYVRPDGSDANTGDSWGAARATVQPALDAAAEGGEVWVAKGVYRERIVIPSRVRLVGGFAGTETAEPQRAPGRNPSVLEGGFKGTVVTIPKTSQVAALDGFTVRHGGMSQHRMYNAVPGGIASFGADATIANNIVEDNYVDFAEDNAEAGGGGLYVGGGPATVRGNIFRRNHVWVWQTFSFPQFGNIVSALGGGLYLRDAQVTVVNNLVEGNDVTTVAEGAMASQKAPLGGGLYAVRVTGLIANNTITQNTTSEPLLYIHPVPFGGAVFLDYCGDGLTVANNIIAFNPSGLARRETTALLAHNDVYGNPEGDYTGTDPTGQDGNIAADPLFVDRYGGDYRLNPTSPAIDAGNDAFATGNADLDGNPRIQGLRVDMGAYEYASTGTITLADVRLALRVAAGLQALDPDVLPRLNVVDPTTSGIDLMDALALLRAL